MRKFIHKNWSDLLKSRTVLAVSGGMLLVSCGTQMGGYTETDGVYYDPDKDTLPVGVVMNEGNQVDEYYDYQDSASIIEKSQHNQQSRDNRYRNDNWTDETATSSDWGTYAGSETNYYNDYWGHPFGFGFYPRFGWGGYYGMGMGFGWGNSWFGSFYDPWFYGSYYSPFYGGFYGFNPYYGYYSPFYAGYGPYGYGYGSYYNYPNYYAPPRRSRGANGISTDGINRMPQQNSGFRTANGNVNRNMQNSTPQNSQPRIRGTQQPRSNTRQMPQQRSEPRFRDNSNYQNNGGFRSGDSGGFRSSGGGFNSGSSSSGGRSSGGFRR